MPSQFKCHLFHFWCDIWIPKFYRIISVLRFFSSVKRFCILCFSLIFTTLDNFLSLSIVLQLSDKRFRIDIGQGGFLGRIQNLVICVRFRSLLSCIFLQFLMGDVFPISEPSVITYLFLKWIFDENANAILLLEMKWTDHSR